MLRRKFLDYSKIFTKLRTAQGTQKFLKMHFGKSYDNLAITFNLTLRVYFPNHGFLGGGKLRQINILESPIEVVDLYLGLPLIISRLT
jgi:hypothetical protein